MIIDESLASEEANLQKLVCYAAASPPDISLYPYASVEAINRYLTPKYRIHTCPVRGQKIRSELSQSRPLLSN